MRRQREVTVSSQYRTLVIELCIAWSAAVKAFSNMQQSTQEKVKIEPWCVTGLCSRVLITPQMLNKFR